MTAVDTSWQRIKAWFAEHNPPAVDTLNGPASVDEIAVLESDLGLALPEDFKASLKIHDGNDGQVENRILPGGFSLFPAAVIAGDQREMDLLEPHPTTDEPHFRPDVWRRRVESGQTTIFGPVKPFVGGPHRVPIMGEDTMRLMLDFDPAPGGNPGQVIFVDFECDDYRVAAGSFGEFLANYADELESGHFYVEENGDIDRGHWPVRVTEVMPQYLRDADEPSGVDLDTAAGDERR